VEEKQVTEHRSPLDQALDLMLYAPVGFVVTAGEELPRLIEKGRAQMSGQVGMARLVGRFAVAQGQREAGKVVRQAAQVLTDLGVLPGDRPGPADPPRPKPADAGRAPRLYDDAVVSAAAVDVVVSDDGLMAEPFEVATPSGQDLAIPGYDALSASQVVQRLAGLSPEELEDVRAYELNTRGRRTILNKVAQLQTGPS
jgi:hypothetical protein